MAGELRRKIVTGDDRRRMMNIGVTYNFIKETLLNLRLLPIARQVNRASSVTRLTESFPKTRPAGSDRDSLAGE